MSREAVRLILPDRATPYHVKRAALAEYLRPLPPDPGTGRTLQAAVDWLCAAQDSNSSHDRGAARHFSLVDGWGPSYPETSGYIVPTLLRSADMLGRPELRDRAIEMLDWLVSIQNVDGSFNGGTIDATPKVPVLFNTGQILIGLASAAANLGTGYAAPMELAADWMLSAQDEDGGWTRFESPFARPGPRTYDTHAAIGLIETTRVTGRDTYAGAACRNIDWAIRRQNENGWFRDCCITDPTAPLTHAIGYTIRGILAAYEYSKKPEYLDSANRALDALLTCQRPDGSLPGRLGANWQPLTSWSCITGNLQIAECWIMLHEISGQSAFLDAARKVNQYSRRIMLLDGPTGSRGAMPGSVPLNGQYNPYQYLNWATKFFVDSHLEELRTKPRC